MRLPQLHYIHSHAEVTLFIRNRGADAYRPDVYGDRIVIIRSLSTTSSGYKIKGTLHPSRNVLDGVRLHHSYI